MKAGMFFASPIPAEHLEHRFVRAAVRGTPQARDTGGDARERIRARRAGEAHRRGRGVLLVVGVQDQDALHRAREHRVRLPLLARRAEHHVEEVLDVGERVLRVHERLADVVLVGHRRDRRQLRDQAERGDLAAARIVDVDRVVIERGERADDAAQHGHRMRIAAETGVEARELLVHHRVVHDDLHELVELRLVRQLAVQDEVGDFEESARLRELLDRVAPIEQDALVAVDEGDVRAAARGRHEAGVVGEHAGLRVERAHVDHLRAHRAAEHGKVDRRRAVAERQGCELFCHNVLRFQSKVSVFDHLRIALGQLVRRAETRMHASSTARSPGACTSQ